MSDDITRSVDMNQVIKRLSARLTEANLQLATMEVAFSEAAQQAGELQKENLELKQQLGNLKGQSDRVEVPEPRKK